MIMTDKINEVYWERNQLVAVLSKLFPSHLSRHPDDDKDWEDDWRTIVCIHTPVGQATWHVHDDEKNDFSHLEEKSNDWDGHSTEEKYKRLSMLPYNSVRKGFHAGLLGT